MPDIENSGPMLATAVNSALILTRLLASSSKPWSCRLLSREREAQSD
jgi:hypothetical protein